MASSPADRVASGRALPRSTRAALAFAVLAAVFVAIGLVASRDSRTGGPARGPAPEGPRGPEVGTAVDLSDPVPGDPGPRSAAGEGAVGEDEVSGRWPAQAAEAPLLVLHGQIRSATGQPVRDPRGTLALSGSALVPELVGDSFRFVGVEPGVHTLSVDVEGYWPFTGSVEVGPDSEAAELLRPSPRSAAVCVVRRDVVLRPRGFAAVQLFTADGRPYQALAEDLGHEPGHLFAGAFEVVVADLAPEGGRLDAVGPESRAGRFLPGTNAVWGELEDAPAIIGSVSIDDASVPASVGLAVLGTVVGWETWVPDQTVLRFSLTASPFEGRLGSVGLQVVGPDGGPLAGLRAELVAEGDSRRRPDHEVDSDPDGRVRFEQLLGGDYDLLVHAPPGSVYQSRVLLEPGEDRDLGTITLPPTTPIEVVVTDRDGGPVSAIVELGPYLPGFDADELFPPLAYRVDERGVVTMPAPAMRAVVRATGWYDAGSYPTSSQSQNSLLDPGALPSSLLLIVQSPTSFDFLATGGTTVEVVDAHGLVVQRRSNEPGKPIRLKLIPGAYTARILDESGGLVREEPIAVPES